MKRFLLYLAFWSFLIVLHMPLKAQVLTAEHHRPNRTDSMSVYKLPFVQVSDTGRHCVWDFSNISTANAGMVNVDFYGLSTADTTLFGLHREHTNSYYRYAMDTLWMTGYENARARVHFSPSLPFLRFPFAYGDSLRSDFTGEGQYCHLLPLHVQGSTLTHADASGRLLLPDMTIDSTLRIHSRMYYQVNADSSHICIERYLWFSPRYHYPLWETRLVQSVKDTATTMYAASYYAPQEPEWTDEDITEPRRDLLESQEENMEEEEQGILMDVAYLPNPVYTHLQVNYTLVRSAQVYISLHYNGGMTAYQSSLHREDEGAHSVSINMSGMPMGTYVVYIHADDTIVSGNIIKL